MSRLAAWSGRLALFALAATVISITIVRYGLLEIEPSLATFAAALVLAGLAALLSFPAFIVIWQRGLAGLGRALLGLFLGLMLLAYPAYLAYRSVTLPPISDVTTDTATPPRFDALTRLRPRGRIDYPGAATAKLQTAAYPDIAPLELDVPPKLAYDIALALVTKRKWDPVFPRPAPATGRGNAVIEAVARTPIMGFRDDVVIRISALGQGSRVDMRSASRFGTHDLGANASRVRAFLSDVDDVAGSAPELRRQPEKKAEPPAKKKR